MDSKEFIINEDNIRLDKWIIENFNNYSRTYIQKLINEGFITVNGCISKVGYKIKKGDMIKINVPEPKSLEVIPEKIDIPVIYEDNDILIINKPKGMVVHPACGNYSKTLVNGLLEYCKDDLSDINGVIRPGIVHRIDKDTSGILVVAKNNNAHQKLSEQFKVHSIKRVYYAIVCGVIKENSGKIDAPIGRSVVDRKKMSVNTKNGRPAVTYFKVIERFRNYTFIEVTLETGRTHQIRVHMAYIGYPVLGDKVYGSKKQDFDIEGQALHAKILGFIHPSQDDYVEFQSDLPGYFQDILKSL